MSSTTQVELSRIQRMVDALSMVSVGQYEQAQRLTPQGEDEMATLEQTLVILATELKQAHEDSARAMAEVEGSRRELRDKLDTIERQQLAIRDLSTPIIELWDDVLTLPIVGVVDTQRSLEMTEKLLHRIVETRARCVIIDVTGVDVVDTMTADHFVKMIRAGHLLGAYCVVTGISPEIAQTLVRIGVDLGGVRTLRSLKEGLKACFAHLRGAPDANEGKTR